MRELELRFDRFYRHEELSAILKGFAQRKPALFSVESIGKSHEGRDIPVVTVTNAATGPASQKPAFWIDGNIHAAELTASTACLYYLNALEQGYGTDPDITRLVDRLSKRVLVKRTRNQADRRVVQVEITQKGLDLLRELDPHVQRMPRALLGHVSQTRLQLLSKLLTEVLDGMGTFP
jgi:hypothetical protein